MRSCAFEQDVKAAVRVNFATFTEWPACDLRRYPPNPLSSASPESKYADVGDAAGFCTEGGMIALLLDRDRRRFEIRFDATEDAGLTVSSRVLALAKTVHGKK